MRTSTRVALILLAGLLMLAVMSATALGKKKTKKVSTHVTLEVHYYAPSPASIPQRWFLGTVSAKKGKCVKGRSVTLVGDFTGPTRFQAKSGSDGSFFSFVDSDDFGSSEFGDDTQFYATAKKKKKGKTVCKAGKSSTVGISTDTPPPG